MPTLYDSQGNEVRAGWQDRVNGDLHTDTRPATNVLGAPNAEVVIATDGAQTVSVDIRTAAAVLTYIFEYTIDGVNYFPVSALALASAVGATVIAEQWVGSVTLATTHAASYVIDCGGARQLRVRVSAWTSGNITVAMRATAAQHLVHIKHIPSILWVTATAAANAIATATLPAAGAGLFHYITHIECKRNATAALVGGATLIVTSTNLPGNPAWSNGNAMAAGGSSLDVSVQPAVPIKSLVANTATTIVMPAAGVAVLNRINVGYYVGA